jgi:AcrR family transcriptional regulator
VGEERNRTKQRSVFRNIEDLAEKGDPRVRRTRDRLGDALVELLVEKSFDDITVHDVLERAGVSRSTFYTHYRDKNDLFLSDAEEFFEALALGPIAFRRQIGTGRAGAGIVQPHRGGAAILQRPG